MSNHYHLVIRPLIDGEMSRFMGWIGGTHTMRYHAHYHTSGLGHVYHQRYKSFPIQMELDAVRLSAHRGRPLGDEAWVESIARLLNLESTIRPRGRQKVRSQQESSSKDDRPLCGAELLSMTDVTQILSQIESGDPAAAAQLLPLLYAELRRLAAARMANERSDHTLQATALVHEAYMRLVDVDQAQHWNSRGHFFSAAAEAMRRILIESARRKQSSKRGGEHKRIEIKEDLAQTLGDSPDDLIDFNAPGGGPASAERALGDSPDDLIDFNSALDELAQEDPQAAELVKLRIFAGLSVAEASRVLGMPGSTAHDNWEFARAWLTCRLRSDR